MSFIAIPFIGSREYSGVLDNGRGLEGEFARCQRSAGRRRSGNSYKKERGKASANERPLNGDRAGRRPKETARGTAAQWDEGRRGRLGKYGVDSWVRAFLI